MVAVDHDAELQHELRRALQESLQQPQHVDVSALEHQTPVEMTLTRVAMPTALHSQVQGVDVPGDTQRGNVKWLFRFSN